MGFYKIFITDDDSAFEKGAGKTGKGKKTTEKRECSSMVHKTDLGSSHSCLPHPVTLEITDVPWQGYGVLLHR